MALSIKLPPKKKSVRSLLHEDEKMMGAEPTFGSKELTTVELIKALNWYVYFNDQKKSNELLFKNYPRDRSEVKLLRKLKDWEIQNQLGYLATMKARGAILPQQSADYLNRHLDACLEVAKKRKEEEESADASPSQPSVLDRSREKVRDLLGQVEEQLDEFMKNGYSSDFKPYEWMNGEGVKPSQAKAIADFYEPQLAFVKANKAGEEYENLKPAEIKALIAFLTNLVNSARRHCDNQKVVRKKREPKAKPIAKQIAGLRYLREWPELKLVSVDPASIVGAQQLWVYNVKNRNLTRYDAVNRDGLGVKGTKLINYDVDAAEHKKLRKPEETLQRVLSGGKLVLRKVLDELTTKPGKPNGRINEETILLRSVR